jgi:hypothetical protein
MQLFFYCNGQINHPLNRLNEDSLLAEMLKPPKPTIDTVNHLQYSADLKRLCASENADSLERALQIMYELCEYLPTQYNHARFREMLSDIDDFKIRNAMDLSGIWKSEAMGNNWMTDKFVNPNKKIVFTRTEALFYRKDSLVRRTTYQFVPNLNHPWAYDNLNLCFSDTNEQWDPDFINVGERAPYQGIAKVQYLMLNMLPGCVCGCPEELYSRTSEISL